MGERRMHAVVGEFPGEVRRARSLAAREATAAAAEARMYSLVSPSVLCMDLVRHTNGIGVIDVLDRTLTLTRDDLPALKAVHRDDAARDAAWAEVDTLNGTAPRFSDAVAAVREKLAHEGLPGLAGQGLADRLSRTPLFGLTHLLTMVRHDVLDWTWDRTDTGDPVAVQRHPEAVAVVGDAVAAAYARDQLSVSAFARLGGPWSQLHRERPVALPGGDEFGPQSRELRELVERLAHLTERDFATLEQAAGRARAASQAWASLMHGASWATYLSGRLRPACRAQLAATRALLLAGVTPVQAACGVMRVVTAAVQALVVSDLLDGQTYDGLLAPWTDAFGAL